MIFNIETATDVLRKTPLVIKTMLSGLSEEWTHTNEGTGTWSPFQVVGHLIINEETNFLPRTQLILSTDIPKVLSPINMTAHLERFNDISINELLQRFEDLRNQNLLTLQSLGISGQDLTKTAIHPKVGEIRLSNILSTWVAHDLIHIGQISRVMAKQFKSEVGPFIEFLPRLK